MVKTHLLAEGAQQCDDGVLVRRLIELGDERQCVGIIEKMKRWGCQRLDLKVVKRTRSY